MPRDKIKCHSPHHAAAFAARIKLAFEEMAGDAPERLAAAVEAWAEAGEEALGAPVSRMRIIRHAAAALAPDASGEAADRLRAQAAFADAADRQAPRVYLTYHDAMRTASNGTLPSARVEIEGHVLKHLAKKGRRADPADVYHKAVLAWLHERGCGTEPRKLVAEAPVARLATSIRSMV